MAGGSWGAGTDCSRGDSLVAPGAAVGAARSALRVQRGCQGWDPSGLCCGFHIPCVCPWREGQELLSPPPLTSFLPFGGKWDCPAPPSCAAFQRGPREVPGWVPRAAAAGGWWHRAASLALAPQLPGQASLPAIASPPVPAFPSLPAAAAPAAIPCPGTPGKRSHRGWWHRDLWHGE